MAGRALALSLVAAGLALTVVVATDEGAGARARLALMGALAPALGALGTAAATQLAAARGELRALEALGAAPSRVRRGAVVGGAVVALVGAGAAASLGDVGVLLPRPVTSVAWVVEADGIAVVEPGLGLRVARDGTPSLLPRPADVPGRRADSAGGAAGAAMRAWIAVALVAAAAAPAWIVARGGAGRKAATALVVVVGFVVAFQAVAAGRAPAFALVLPPAVLFVEAVIAAWREGAPRSSGRATIVAVTPWTS